MPGIYNNIIQELLVQQHLMRWNKKYTYDEVCTAPYASLLGLPACKCLRDGVSVQMPWAARLFAAFVGVQRVAV